MQAALAELKGDSDAFEPDCPTRVLLDHITSRWGVLILVALSSGTMRWGELRRWALGISEKMLAQTLQDLEGDGLIIRKSYDVVPPHVDYTLSPLGQEAADRVEALADWIESSLPRIMEWRQEA
jgi:DNA-binding HxlR family transcriptional regulator